MTSRVGLRGYVQFNKYTHTHTISPAKLIMLILSQFVQNIEFYLSRRISEPKSADFGLRTNLDYLLKHLTLSYLCVMVVFSPRVGASTTVSSSRGLQTRKLLRRTGLQKKDDFSVVERFRVKITAVMST